jgi:hypothetical protein
VRFNQLDSRTLSLLSDSLQAEHAHLFFESAIAILQLEGSTSTIVIPQLFKEMFLHNRNSAFPQSQIFLMSATSSPQLESFISAIFGILMAMESTRFKKKIGGKKSCVTVPLRQVFGFQRNRQF